MAYAKPQVTIDLEEYQELQKKAASQYTSLYQKALGIAVQTLIEAANPSLAMSAVADLSAADLFRTIRAKWDKYGVQVEYRSINHDQGNCIVTLKTT